MTQKPMPEVASAAAATPNIRWAELLGTSYPGPERSVIQLSDRWNDNNWTLATPGVQIHCDAITCSRPSYFDYIGVAPTPAYNQWVPLFLLYRCRHCKQTLAETLRIILTDLAERIQRALKDHTEVFFAVKRLTANKPVART